MNFQVRTTEAFNVWLASLRDGMAKAVIARRIRRVVMGNFGDVKPVGGGVSELRIHHGAGYRVYFLRRGNTVIVLLCGGDKSSQSRDIAQAISLAKEV